MAGVARWLGGAAVDFTELAPVEIADAAAGDGQGVLVVFGLINLGMTIKDGMQGGGGQLSGAIAMIVGGAIVVGAAIYFGQLDTVSVEHMPDRKSVV